MLSITVCIGSACHIKGAYNIINQLQQIIEEKQLDEKVSIKPALCLGHCSNAVSVKIDGEEVVSLSADNVRDFFETVVIKRL
ncbi:(2Fe-2S) ferredoxin domain-containing protein [Pseudobacteroides cellulosolvens]|uniref:NADH dehydrogenase (Ubiquinone) 24 kDa subunit n=1 Tax=Pseudobacteroides cellulosolvens ATCC 35603 = DSM 2933 TaxID=398512 RepID=A0A0L6JJ13_9FIRM|nr:NAD(P)H-dependent oxidoreductase subunit E [Pseudobacteroides cellulosolvens]KNY25724.1 NADH dehydrogenase (ubiquinone) 24 kDa subunit [Pseudobacteroides cellulosolvens ATCC 35603 = DSM 2933]